jgi:hypothetical protein
MAEEKCRCANDDDDDDYYYYYIYLFIYSSIYRFIYIRLSVGRPRNRDSIPSRAKRLFLLPIASIPALGHILLAIHGRQAMFPWGVKPQRREWSYTSTPS